MSPSRTPILLCNGTFHGTLAAARALGKSGVPVTVADPSRAAPALYSRHVARRVRSPRAEDVQAFSAWLLRFAVGAPRHVVYATSDEVSFALALHRDALSERFALYQPDLETTMGILDKGKLDAHARAVGLDVPDTWLPTSNADVARIARDVSFPVMVKPRTQVTFGVHAKGMLASAGELTDVYRRFTRGHHVHGNVVSRLFPEATRPLIQRYHPEAADAIQSLAGFRDRSGAHFAVLGSRKVLQRPRRLGIGLCFESAPVDPVLAAKVEALCARLGYFGVFEIEFIEVEGRSLLIDMNPRFYSQMAFETARGLPLPQLAHAGAANDDAEVARLMSTIPASGHPSPLAYCNRFDFDLQVRAQRLSGRMSPGDAARWRDWITAHGDHLVDAVADPSDPRPRAISAALQVYTHLRHPRVFLRSIALDR